MFSIRKNVFETNSSSVHSIAIPKVLNKELPKKIEFYPCSYSWEEDERTDTANYLYTALIDLYIGSDELKEKIDLIKTTLSNYGIECEFYDLSGIDLSDVYIDHPEDLRDFIDLLLSNDTFLLNFLIDGTVFTGNDCLDNTSLCYSAEALIGEFNSKDEWITTKNPNHKEEFFYYRKGN